MEISQRSLLEDNQSRKLDQERVRRSLDDLFSLARKYRKSNEYWELLKFVAKFDFYSPYNAMLVHIQKPGASFVAPPHRWLSQYGRHIRPGAQPLVVLQPMGPVMFVFDVSDTEPGTNAPRLPFTVENPFAVRAGHVSSELPLTIENAKRDGVRVGERKSGSQAAGCIRSVHSDQFQEVVKRSKLLKESVWVPIRYELLLSEGASRETKYATLVHELAHLYCGHLGTPNREWWPERQNFTPVGNEFEAESISYLVCSRLKIDTPSEKYLADYVGDGNPEVPEISLECVMKAAGLIEQMGNSRLKPRKDKRE